MNRLNDLPCIDVQDRPLLLACNAMHPEDHDNIGGHAHVSDCTYLGEDDPKMERVYRANGSLAKVTFFDKGNCWTSIDDIETKTDMDAREFISRLWTETFDNADNKNQHRKMLADAISYCTRDGGCTCAVNLVQFTR